MLDHDPDEVALSREELVGLIRSAAPGLADAAMLWWPSASSHICDAETGEELAGLRLGGVLPSPDLDRLRARRTQVGLPAGDDAPLLLHPDGEPVTAAQVPLHLRRARLTGVRIGEPSLEDVFLSLTGRELR